MRGAYLLLQRLLPHHLLTALARRWGAIRWRPLKNLQIRGAVRQFGIDLSESESADPDHYPSFDAFFTRALRPGARSPDADPRAVLMPADGRISAAGAIDGDRILQAKGRDYSLAALVGDATEAGAYAGGRFATVYLQPRNYHRVHMPLAGTLRRTTYIPGRLFSVAPVTVEGIDAVFARNERLVCHFDTAVGPVAVVLVGAMIVAGIETVWSGWLQAPRDGVPLHTEFPPGRWTLDRFAELGRFHFGSTAIVLFAPGQVRLDDFRTGQEVRVGQRLGVLAGTTR